MSRKTFYIIAAVWFALIVFAAAGSFIPGVDQALQTEVRKYLPFVVVVGALCLIMIRQKVDK